MFDTQYKQYWYNNYRSYCTVFGRFYFIEYNIRDKITCNPQLRQIIIIKKTRVRQTNRYYLNNIFHVVHKKTILSKTSLILISFVGNYYFFTMLRNFIRKRQSICVLVLHTIMSIGLFYFSLRFAGAITTDIKCSLKIRIIYSR